MNTDILKDTTDKLLAKGKGILAADESNKTAAKRLGDIGMESTEETRRQYREIFFKSQGVENYLSGVILYDETMRQSTFEGEPFPQFLENLGVLPGIKVDMSTVPLPGFPEEVVTEGLDGLPERLAEYASMGAKFAKWRAVIRIGEGIPTPEAIRANALLLARYARLCQDAGIVPIVEPEVLLDGDHTIERCEGVLTEATRVVFDEIRSYRADLRYVILKSSMVLPGKDSGQTAEPTEVAERTVRALMASVPEEVPGVVFLSGGQTPEEATENLNAIAKLEPLPFEIAFSYARALQGPALEAWQGKEENWQSAQETFIESLKSAVKADMGEY